MYRCICTFIFCFFAIYVYGQQSDNDKSIQNEDMPTDIRERLVQLAWSNHPGNQIAIKDFEIAKVNLTQAQWAWLNQINASGNLNEFTINPNPEVNLFYPRYNFGVNIPLGIFVMNPTNTKISELELIKADLEVQNQKIIIRNQVLSAYENYLRYEKIYNIRRDLTEIEYASFLVIEEKFESGEVTLDNYKIASKEYSTELENQIIAKNQLENAKLVLEMLIGSNLEDALKSIKK